MTSDLLAWAQRHGVSSAALAELAALSLPAAPLAVADDTDFRVGAARDGVMLWRNNSGVAYNGAGRPVRFGLGNDSAKLNDVMKSSDYIGIIPGGRFIAVERKAANWKYKGDSHEIGQRNYIDTVIRYGGVGMFARSWAEVRQALTP